MSDIQTITEQAARDARDVFESYGGKAREAIDYMEQLIYAAMRKTEPATDAAQSRAPFFFDRYINGVRMAEDVCIERETTLEGAMQAATRIAAKGPNGEAPVLVYRAPAADARAEVLKEAAALFNNWWVCAPDGSNLTEDVQTAILALINKEKS